MKLSVLFALLLMLPLALFANENEDPLLLKLRPTEQDNTYRLTVTDDETLWSGEVTIAPNEVVCEELKKGLSFCGKMSEDGRSFRGFIKSGFMHYQVILTETGKGELEGHWNKLVRYEQSPKRTKVSYARFTGYKY